MGKKYNNRITTTAGFNFGSPGPLDDRAVVESYTDLASLNTYEGMEVYVIENKKSYKLIDTEWVAVATEASMSESFSSLFSSGTADPGANTASQFYFKYSE